jgi:hypothetical protein
LSRRGFLQSGAAIAAIAATPGIVAARQTFDSAGAAIAIHEAMAAVVVERNAAGAADFSLAVSMRNMPLVETGADLGPAWMQSLEPQLRQAPVALAGLSTTPSLFSLLLMAQDYGLALARRIEIDNRSGWPDTFEQLLNPKGADETGRLTASSLPAVYATAVPGAFTGPPRDSARSVAWLILPRPGARAPLQPEMTTGLPQRHHNISI